MNKRDKPEEEMEEMMRKSGRELELPERLRPEAVRQALEQKNVGKDSKAGDASNNSGNIADMSASVIRKPKRRWGYWGMAAAAILCLVCGVVWSVSGSRNRQVVHDGQNGNMGAVGRRTVTADKEIRTESEKLTYAGSYEEVYSALAAVISRRQERDKDYVEYDLAENYMAALSSEDSASTIKNAAESTGAVGAQSTRSHSETNVSVEGIAEADQVITDGEYIYRLRETADVTFRLDIIRADGGTMDIVGKYVCGRGESVPREFFLADDRLILLSTKYALEEACTEITFIDISDRTKPAGIGKLTQSGIYSEARLQDGYLYTVSGGGGWCRTCVVGEDGSVKIGEKDIRFPRLNGKKVSAGEIYIPKGCDTTEFTNITSVNLSDISKFADNRSIMTNLTSGYMHMTEDSIYLTSQKWADLSKTRNKKKVTAKTQITKFTYHDGKFTGKATKTINGSIRDTFAINEYEGNLRVISSISYYSGKDDNAVYILDEDLEIIGQIEHLAKDERVYSARFQGDIGYFVTYRETDPLFSVDFSDPHNPKILGELKIPGFSEYMHFYNDHLLFGLGLENVNEEDQVIKLSMYDVSDPTDVKEIYKIFLKDMVYTGALYDYKKVLIDPTKNIIGFEAWGYTDDDLRYVVYSFDEEKGFVQRMNLKVSDDFNSVRGLYIDDTLYLADLASVSLGAYDLNSGKRIGKYPKK